MEDPGLIGETVTLEIPASDPFDQLNKGQVRRDTPEAQRRVDDFEVALFDQLVEQGRVSTPFNFALFTNADSRFPELAGLAGAITGSFFALLVCFILSFPIGIAAAVYLEEFAPKNRWTDVIEVNINNLCGGAVDRLRPARPRRLPRLVRSARARRRWSAGMVLSLMTLPTIIIATRAALKAVPPSIREAALGVGASKHEVVMHHVLPARPSGQS